jgi:hypothetical protein
LRNHKRRSGDKPFSISRGTRRRRSRTRRKKEEPAAAGYYNGVMSLAMYAARAVCKGRKEEVADVAQEILFDLCYRGTLADVAAGLQQTNFDNDSYRKATQEVFNAVNRIRDHVLRPHRLRQRVEDPSNPGQTKQVRRQPRMVSFASIQSEVNHISNSISDTLDAVCLTIDFLGSLSEIEGDVIKLTLDGYTVEKIAAQLTVKSYVVRKALRAIRRRLEEILATTPSD